MPQSTSEAGRSAASVSSLPSITATSARNWRDYALLFALACCWSSTYPLAKLALDTIPPVTFISARSLIAVAFLFAILWMRGIKVPTDAKAWKLFATQQLINSTFPFLITSLITRHEPATLLKLAGAILGLAGTILIVGLDALHGLGSEIIAEIAILLATISFACATIFGLRLSEYDPMVVAAGSLLFGGLVLLPPALLIDQPWTLHPTPTAIIATIVMGIVSSALGLMLFYVCLGRLGTLTTNAQGYLRIPIGVGLSVLLLGESVPSNLALGLLLVMAGVAAMTVPAEKLKLR